MGTVFYKFELSEVQINLHFGQFGLIEIVLTTSRYRDSTELVCFIPQCDDSFPTMEERKATLSFTNKTSLALSMCAFKLHVEFLADEQIVKIE